MHSGQGHYAQHIFSNISNTAVIIRMKSLLIELLLSHFFWKFWICTKVFLDTSDQVEGYYTMYALFF